MRVEAARLRAQLTEYYAGDGHGDAVVSACPKAAAPVIKIAAHRCGNERRSSSAAPTSPAPLAPATAAPQAVSPSRLAAGQSLRACRRGDAGRRGLGAVDGAATVGALRVAVLPFTPYPDAADASASAVAMRVTGSRPSSCATADACASRHARRTARASKASGC